MNGLAASLARSDEWIRVRRRVFRQLIESLLYEQVIREPVVKGQKEEDYVLAGRTEKGEPVQYAFRAVRKKSFGRIRLSEQPILRITPGGSAEAESLPRFLLEMSAGIVGTTAELLSRFASELEQTLLKDAQAVRWRSGLPDPETLDYDEWESTLIEGHPYHPCYKSRIGFTLEDNMAYGPEFRPAFRIVWLAIRREAVVVTLSETLGTYDEFVHEELGEGELKRFGEIVRETLPHVDANDYAYVPVHPWQWERIISAACLEQLHAGEIVYLGQAGDMYRPQQSIRTLTNVTDSGKPYVKLPMNIVNTSSGRILAQHTIMNAARISDWLGSIVTQDAFLGQEMGLIMLKEIAGISYRHQKLPELLERNVYGSLGAIWRESLHPRLAADESALPFNALTQIDRKGKPIISPWVERYELESWSAQLLRVSVVPLLHLLYAHGAGLESHAQNMILILKQGWPTRIALKDFHDGVRYCPSLPHPLGYPNIEYPPANHHGVNRNSFVEKEEPAEVKDFLLDALLFINLTEISFFLEKHYGLGEEAWWETLAGIIRRYQERFPELRERFEQFDVFSPEIEIEQLTRRRIHAGTEDCVQRAANPLHAYRPLRQNEPVGGGYA